VKKVLSDKDRRYISRAVDSMYSNDQDIRSSLWQIDSIYKVGRNSTGRFLTSKQKKQKLGQDYHNYENAQDSIYSIMKEINITNTRKLIEITQKFGFPSMERLKATKAKAYLIFVHAPKKYYEEIRSLITSEFKANRISEYEKAYIFWHINNRVGFPPRLSKKGKVIYDQ
jgi:hypothetical protein